MNIESRPSAVATATPVYRLEGKARKQWWQIGNGWGLRREKIHNNQNHSLRMTLHPLLVFPFFLMFHSSSWQGIPFNDQILFWASAVTFALALKAVFLSCFRRHQHHILEVRVNDAYLELKSPGLNRQIRWHDIEHFFLNGNTDVGWVEYALICRNGEVYYLSKDLTNSEQLIAYIEKRLPSSAVSHEQNYGVHDGFFDMPVCAALAIVMAICSMITGTFASSTTIFEAAPGFAFWLLLLCLPLGFCWFYVAKVPQLIRSDESGLLVLTRSDRQFIPWDQISGIKSFGRWITLKSPSRWFLVPIMAKTDPITLELIKRGKQLPKLHSN